jgi:hypothetical protein
LIYVAHGATPALGFQEHHDLPHLAERVLPVNVAPLLKCPDTLFQLARRHISSSLTQLKLIGKAGGGPAAMNCPAAIWHCS